jgi:hypothetical protein
MTRLYRGMKPDPDDGCPSTGPGKRLLGAVPGIDILPDDAGMVYPGTEGMSVSPHSPEFLPEWRRPPALGGTGKDPVWVIESEKLPTDLIYAPDGQGERHGWVEPSTAMTLTSYQDALAETRETWERSTEQ